MVTSIVTALEDFSKRMDTMEKRFTQTHHDAEATRTDDGASQQPRDGQLPENARQRDGDNICDGTGRRKDAASTQPSTSAKEQARRRLQELDLTYDTEDSQSDEEYQDRRHKAKGKMTGKLRTAEHKVKFEVQWPHFYVYKHDNTAATYDDLNISEFVYGYLCMIDDSPASQRSVLHSHLKQLMEDTTLYQWAVIRGYHAVVLNMIETGRLTWADTERIQALRRVHVWQTGRMRQSDTKQARPTWKAQSDTNTQICQAYQSGSCAHNESHGAVTHACAYCWSNLKRVHQHPLCRCRKRPAGAKNDQQDA